MPLYFKLTFLNKNHIVEPTSDLWFQMYLKKKYCKYEINIAEMKGLEEAMKPKLCIVGYQPVINIAQKSSREFAKMADFIFICALMEEALPRLQRR